MLSIFIYALLLDTQILPQAVCFILVNVSLQLIQFICLFSDAEIGLFHNCKGIVTNWQPVTWEIYSHEETTLTDMSVHFIFFIHRKHLL